MRETLGRWPHDRPGGSRAPAIFGSVRELLCRVHSGVVAVGGDQVVIGVGSQGRPMRAAWMAEMAPMPWLRVVTR